jgi:hypothetical protein
VEVAAYLDLRGQQHPFNTNNPADLGVVVVAVVEIARRNPRDPDLKPTWTEFGYADILRENATLADTVKEAVAASSYQGVRNFGGSLSVNRHASHLTLVH